MFGPDDGFAIAPELRLAFSLPSKDIGPPNAELTDQGGYWGTNSLNLPIALNDEGDGPGLGGGSGECGAEGEDRAVIRRTGPSSAAVPDGRRGQ